MQLVKNQPTFIADGMLGTTARKLRILGYDTVYDTNSSDCELKRLARSMERTLLTNDHELFIDAKSSRVDVILVKGDEEEKLYRVLFKSGVRGIDVDNLVSRCSICNGELSDIGEKAKNGSKVYSCLLCGKRYWRGGHWRKLILLFAEVNSMLNKELE